MWGIDDQPNKSWQSHPLNTSLHVCAFNCMRGVNPSDKNCKSEFVVKIVNWSTQDCNNALRIVMFQKRIPLNGNGGMKYASLTDPVNSPKTGDRKHGPCRMTRACSVPLARRLHI